VVVTEANGSGLIAAISVEEIVTSALAMEPSRRIASIGCGIGRLLVNPATAQQGAVAYVLQL